MEDTGGDGRRPPGEDGGSNDRTAILGGKLFMAAALFFLASVVFVVVLYLYTRWRLGRRMRRRSGGGADGGVYQSDYDAEIGGTSTRIHGLDTEVIESLPIVVFEKKNFDSGIECAVCLSELVDGEKARVLPKCSHEFHLECIDMWFYSHSTCPLCRNPVGLDNQTAEPGSSSETEAEAEEENSNLPTNVLFWGTGTGLVQETLHNSSSTPRTTDGMLVIDVPTTSAPLPPSSSKSSPTPTRLRSLKRLFVDDSQLQ